MILNIHVNPKSSRNFIKKEENSLKVYPVRKPRLVTKMLSNGVYLTKTPQKGLANEQLIELLAEYLNVKKYQVKIIRGEKSRNKVIEID